MEITISEPLLKSAFGKDYKQQVETLVKDRVKEIIEGACKPLAELVQCCASGEKIQAIKRLRAITGLGLAASKFAIESYFPPFSDKNYQKKEIAAFLRVLDLSRPDNAAYQIEIATGLSESDAKVLANNLVQKAVRGSNY